MSIIYKKFLLVLSLTIVFTFTCKAQHKPTIEGCYEALTPIYTKASNLMKAIEQANREMKVNRTLNIYTVQDLVTAFDAIRLNRSGEEIIRHACYNINE